jgi:hypothetical protein
MSDSRIYHHNGSLSNTYSHDAETKLYHTWDSLDIFFCQTYVRLRDCLEQTAFYKQSNDISENLADLCQNSKVFSNGIADIRRLMVQFS